MKKSFLLLLPLLLASLFSISCSKTDDLSSRTPSDTDPQPDAYPDQTIQSKTFTVGGVSFNMMLVEAGTFTMGANHQPDDPFDDEQPAHLVTLTNDYYLGQTEVTQDLWQAVMGSNPSDFKDLYLPVEKVSWYDCHEFIRRLTDSTGCHFRLPTEAEWEFAARGGNNSSGCRYAGSNNLDEVAWYGANSHRRTNPVGVKRPNELGLYDMNGNVFEWCQDGYGPYSSAPQTNPSGPADAPFRVLRGGSWISLALYCRIPKRDANTPDFSFGNIGLRLALSD